MSDLVPRQSVEHIVRCRDEALRLYDVAFDQIAAAHAAVMAAHNMARQAAPRSSGNYSYDRTDEIKAFYSAVALPDGERYRRVARRLTDIACWDHIVQMTDLERLMDAEAKQKLREQMRYVPDRVDRDGQLINADEIAKGLPPISLDTIYATLDQFRRDAGMIWRRGIANAFSKLDRRFKSHDGFKIGGRIIVTRMFNDSGRLEWGDRRDTLVDVERVFAILDGQTESSFQSTLYMLERERGGSWNPRQSTHENDFFRVRCFMNGNAHLWFTRDDLVEKVNKLLAEHYGETIGDGQTAEDDPLENRKVTPAKRFGFFPTPPDAADLLFSGRWHRGIVTFQPAKSPRLRILEPSAGTGNLARRCVTRPDDLAGWRRSNVDEYRFDNAVDCVEIQPELAAGLEAEGIYNRVIRADFLSLSPGEIRPYDLIVMNPPFDRERDIDHVTHALKFLAPGGSLHAIMSAGTELRETRKAVAFRALAEKHKAEWEELPAGSFAETGTYVNTIIVRMRRPVEALS